MTDKSPTSGQSHPKPFPWRCSTCKKVEVRPAVIAHVANVKYHGKMYSIEVPDLNVLQCSDCGELLFTQTSQEQIYRTLRQRIGLLQPDEIRSGRERIGWSQKQLADAVHAAPETISRWETGAVIQSKRADKALRNCFGEEFQIPTPISLRNAAHDSPRNREAEKKIRDWFESCASDVIDWTTAEGCTESLAEKLLQGKERWVRLFILLAEHYSKSGDGVIRDTTAYLKAATAGGSTADCGI